jgi:hypothetical protein
MKTIVITIQVPDGVNVQVGQGQQPAQTQDFTPRPDPAHPGGVCPEHGTDWRLVKAGFSKTKKNDDGTPKRFNAFWVCSTQGCNEKPPRASDNQDQPLLEQLPF